jgi:hypothetical protein
MVDMETKLKALDDVTNVAIQPGNALADDYLQGMANGLILAQAIMKGAEPEFIKRPNTPLKELAPAILAAANGTSPNER